jgi:hypothetical protein
MTNKLMWYLIQPQGEHGYSEPTPMITPIGVVFGWMATNFLLVFILVLIT